MSNRWKSFIFIVCSVTLSMYMWYGGYVYGKTQRCPCMEMQDDIDLDLLERIA